MAIEFIEGFEVSTAATLPPEFVVLGGMSVMSPGRFGTGMLGASGGALSKLTLPPSARKTVGFALRSNANAWGSASTYLPCFYTDAGSLAQLSVSVDGTGHILIRYGANGTILATSTQALTGVVTGNEWRYVEVQVTINDVAGRCTVKVDGTTWIDFTGDTKFQASAGLIDTMAFAFSTYVNNSTTTSAIDDIYVCNEVDDSANTGRADNTFLGDCRVDALLPTGDGASSQWVPSTGTSHFALVDEVPPNQTDWVGSSVVGDRDLWSLPDLPGSGTRVFAIRSLMYAAKNDAGSASLKQLARDSSGTVTADPAQLLGTTWANYWGKLRTAKPSGGAWTQAEINAMQLGAERGA